MNDATLQPHATSLEAACGVGAEPGTEGIAVKRQPSLNTGEFATLARAEPSSAIVELHSRIRSEGRVEIISGAPTKEVPHRFRIAWTEV